MVGTGWPWVSVSGETIGCEIGTWFSVQAGLHSVRFTSNF